ncbi:MAG: NAD(P)H-hydrate dehydratase [Candidatus Margulisbacteria bacterium]|nr:NAD(P)H-hydrate dehydratase [Candidatus Margulisiibacteriota bacterium]
MSTLSDMAGLLPKRPLNAHKGMVGRVGVIAGSSGMMGAAFLTSKSTLKTGAGLVYLMSIDSPPSPQPEWSPELIYCPLPSHSGHLSRDALVSIKKYIHDHQIECLAVGPGLGRASDTQHVVQQLLQWISEIGLPCVLDADGLMAIQISHLKQLNKGQIVMTPHPKEFQTVFGVAIDSENRKEMCEEMAVQSHQIVVLKGAQTVVSFQKGSYINETGNAGMATAGSGDVLTGIIAGLMGQKLTLYNAAKLGVYIHGLAGDYAKKELSEYSLTASDIIAHLGDVFKSLEAHGTQ